MILTVYFSPDVCHSRKKTPHRHVRKVKNVFWRQSFKVTQTSLRDISEIFEQIRETTLVIRNRTKTFWRTWTTTAPGLKQLNSIKTAFFVWKGSKYGPNMCGSLISIHHHCLSQLTQGRRNYTLDTYTVDLTELTICIWSKSKALVGANPYQYLPLYRRSFTRDKTPRKPMTKEPKNELWTEICHLLSTKLKSKRRHTSSRLSGLKAAAHI